MAKHTPGRWYNAGRQIWAESADREPIAGCQSHLTRDEDEANAARIVACFNACEGMDDPAKDIADMERSIGDLAEHKAALRAQRDELAEALQAVLPDLRGWLSLVRREYGHHSQKSALADARYHAARAALARLDGGK